MSYHGLVQTFQKLLVSLDHEPAVLEIGVDRGVTLIPLAVAMASAFDSFSYVGVDVKVQEPVLLTVGNLGKTVCDGVSFYEENSLVIIPQFVAQQKTFDLVLIDGDHNYFTVSQELSYVDKLLRPAGVVCIDDYGEGSQWSTSDMFYAERPGYADNARVTKPVKSEKEGVKAAVDDWLVKNKGWTLNVPIYGNPPAILYRDADADK